MAEFNLTVHAVVFLALLVFFQALLTLWSFRHDGSVSVGILVAFLPVIGVPWLLYRRRSQTQDNHIAGALTYLALIVAAFGFLFLYPKLMDDEIPWALIHTMQFFGFLGLANLILSPFKH